MPTFYDSVELEDVDIDDLRASFYLLVLPKNAGYKLCGTIQNLNSPQMKFDPETKIKQYWLISREQVKNADASILFPEGKLRTCPFKTLEELKTIFQFTPPFNPKKADNVIKKNCFGSTQQTSNTEPVIITRFRSELGVIRFGDERGYTFAETIGRGRAPAGLFNQHHVSNERGSGVYELSRIGICKIVAMFLLLLVADHVIKNLDIPIEEQENIGGALLLGTALAVGTGMLGEFREEVPSDVVLERLRNRS